MRRLGKKWVEVMREFLRKARWRWESYRRNFEKLGGLRGVIAAGLCLKVEAWYRTAVRKLTERRCIRIGGGCENNDIIDETSGCV